LRGDERAGVARNGAQAPPLPVIGYFNPAFDSRAIGIAAFRQGLGEMGFVEGKSVAIEYRNAEGQVDRLSAFAAEFVRHPVAVIAATGGSLPALAAKAATSTIPIVFVGAENPVELGLVPRFNRPGGNITGVTLYALALTQKRVELLNKLVPNTCVMALLIRPTDRGGIGAAESETIDVTAAANALGLRCHVVIAGSAAEIDAAFATLKQLGAGALHVSADLLFVTQREQILALAARDHIPTSFWRRDFVDAGGFMSYGASIPEAYREAGRYVGRILRGERAGDLPVLQPAKFEFVINMKTAKALSLDVPPMLLALADEVIE